MQYEVSLTRNYIIHIIWRHYGPKLDILDHWGTIIFGLLYYYILLKDKVYRVETIDMGISHRKWCQWENSHIHKYYGNYCTR